MSLKKLIAWSKTEFSDLPWRKKRTLYGTLVSEIMLQQTTVSTVKNHFDKFMKKYPDIPSLARASEQELLVAWKGLGYYRRARNLKKIAECIYQDHKDAFPSSVEELMKIPGIGIYTAHALRAIGMDQKGLAVDANLERVIARLFALKIEKGTKLQKTILELFSAGKLFNEKVSSRALNEALMDLGRTYCQARKATCELCPLSDNCLAFKSGNPLAFPVLKGDSMKKEKMELQLLRLYFFKGKKLLVYKKRENEWLSGQYEIPTFIIKSNDSTLKQYPDLNFSVSLKDALTFKNSITKYSIINSVMVGDKEILKKIATSSFEWRSFELEEANLSTATLKGLEKLRGKNVSEKKNREKG
jgi:A/G-specific adenine glycosylase